MLPDWTSWGVVVAEGRDAPDEDSSESEGEEASLSQEPKPRSSNSQPSSAVHRPKPRTGASWSVDSSSDDSRRWSDTLSIDEKEGFVFVNYSEGQVRPGVPVQTHSQQPSGPSHGPVPQPLQPSTMEARSYNKLKPGAVDWYTGASYVHSTVCWCMCVCLKCLFVYGVSLTT